jgi:hypothetical protein
MNCPKCGSKLDTGYNCTKCDYRYISKKNNYENKIKEIIAERIKYHSNKEKYGYFIGNDCIDICAEDILEDVIKAGYRKQSETVKEFAEQLKKELFANCVIIQTISNPQKEDMDSSEAFQIINELAEQYGKED